MTDPSRLIESAWATPWEDDAVYGVAWRTAAGFSGAFAAGTKEDAEQIAQEIVGTEPTSLAARYGRRMQHAGEAARDYRSGKLLSLDRILKAL
jgi:hypothetical protein